MTSQSTSVPWYRSWPVRVPKDRAHVVDALPKLLMTNHDYDTIAWPEHDLTLVEWDIAFTPEDRKRFAESCAITPSSVHVAPYTLYPVSTALSTPVFAHRIGDRWIRFGEPLADYIGFGMVYFPLRVVERFKREYSVAHGKRFTDTGFSLWHRENVGPIPVHWDVCPVHLHY